MGRIDEPFGSLSLEEKTEPTEKFIQALDELRVSGPFRKLLEKHFMSSWCHELGSIEKIRKALKCAQQATDISGEISFFLQALSDNHIGNWFQYAYSGFPDELLLQHAKKCYPARFAFAEDIAKVVFPDSIYGFFQCFKDSIGNRFEVFVLLNAPVYYGESCHLTSTLFNDKQLAALGSEKRRSLLWAIFKEHRTQFWAIFEQHRTPWDCSFSEHLMKQYVWDNFAGVPTPDTLRFSQAFEYLEAWVISDSQAYSYVESDALLSEVYTYFNNRRLAVYELKAGTSGGPCGADELEQYKAWAEQWLDARKHEITKAWCCNVSLDGLNAENLECWARRAYEIYLPLYQGFSEARAEVLIDCGLQTDIELWLKPEQLPRVLLEGAVNSKLWYVSSFREIWKKHLAGKVETLSVADRLQIFRRNLKGDIAISDGQIIPQFILLPQEHFKTAEESCRVGDCYVFPVEQEDRDWWDSFMRRLPEEEAFIKKLYPSWTVDMLTRFGYQEPLATYADKSLGIVRGALASGNNITTPNIVEKLLSILQHQAPEKAIRSYLMLLRHSPRPFTSENLDLDRERESVCPQTMSEIFRDLRAAHFRHPTRRHMLSGDEWRTEELKLLFSTRTWLAQYCLSRLQLRKGQKAKDDGYDPKQVVEPSSIWRQGYLKALAELGVDLKGKVHKTVYFTRKFDPDEDVRAVAKECYKAVRREHNKSESEDSIRRGLTAAYWWLLLVQRQALGAPINYEGARLTRRRLLRRP